MCYILNNERLVTHDILSSFRPGWIFSEILHRDTILRAVVWNLEQPAVAPRARAVANLYFGEEYSLVACDRGGPRTDAFLWDVFDLTNSQLKGIDFIKDFQNIKNHNFLVFQNPRYNPSILIANCSAHRPPIEMSLYFLESSGQELSIEHWPISVSCLWAEKLAEGECVESPPPLWRRGEFYTMMNRFNLVFFMIRFEKKFINQ